MTVTPVFIMATPRSGSTLLQRVLTSYDEIGSAAEPWVLLPPLLALLQDPPYAAAWWRQVGTAIRDFVDELPGDDDYVEAVRRFGLDLYALAAPPGARLFVDKSPPYHYIADNLVRTFPDARFVFLWRNPLSVLASTVETFCDGRWKPFWHRGDLFDGLAHLTAAYRRHADRVVAVRYEDLVSGDEAPWRRVTDYLGVEFDPASLERFAEVQFSGRMGDPTGAKRYAALSRDSVDRWRATIRTVARREWADGYLVWLGLERLALMGYDLDALRAELAGVPVGTRGLAADVRDMAEGAARDVVRSRMRDDALTMPTVALLRARFGGDHGGRDQRR
jgi:Sulfotransferase family